MNKDFIPYEQALALKELGFYEECFGLYHSDQTFYPTLSRFHEQYYGQICMAPLYQQTFRYFREKYSLTGEVFSQLRPSDNFMYGFKIAGSDNIVDGFDTYEEAELACLIKLIQIIKSK